MQTNAKTQFKLDIDTLSYGPYGIGRLDGRAIMVPHTAPGDRIEARIVESKERYAIAEAVAILEPSPLRQPPPCKYVPDCGGCSWQHLRYEAQLKAKQQSVDDALRRIGKLANYELRPIIASFDQLHYRRRIRLQCDSEKRLGYFQSASHRLVQIDRCLIADDKLNEVIDLLRGWLGGLASGCEFIEIVSGDEPDQLVVILGLTGDFVVRDETHCEHLVGQKIQVTGLIVQGQVTRRVWGKPWVTVKLANDLALTVDADVFTQVNPAGNGQMLTELLKAGEFQSKQRVLELYCGAGNFTFAIARRAQEVIAVEGHRPAVANGKLNAQKLGLENIRWMNETVPDAIAQLNRRREHFDKIVLDPPRGGAKGSEKAIAGFGAQMLVYVSCNPSTFARDLAGLAKHGYKLTMVQPIDLFPHTFHVEVLGLLHKN